MNTEALFNGTTRNGAGGDETLNDGKTIRGYGRTNSLTLHLDTSKNRGRYDLTKPYLFNSPVFWTHHTGTPRFG